LAQIIDQRAEFAHDASELMRPFRASRRIVAGDSVHPAAPPVGRLASGRRHGQLRVTVGTIDRGRQRACPPSTSLT